MSSTTRTERIAYGLAFLRGAILIAFSLALVLAPEDVMPGTSAEPARTLGLMFASRTILLGVAFIALALRRRARPLAWVFFADAVLMLFEMAMAVATDELGLAFGGLVIGALELWAGRTLHRATTELSG
jgi:hypothetical protein